MITRTRLLNRRASVTTHIQPAVLLKSSQHILRFCTECWSVWIAAPPAAGRQPCTCHHNCQALVLNCKPGQFIHPE